MNGFVLGVVVARTLLAAAPVVQGELHAQLRGQMGLDAGLRVPRLRPGGALIWGDDLRLVAALELAPGRLDVLEAYAETTGVGLRLQGGLLRVPFTSHGRPRGPRAPWPEWAAVTEYFGAERQLGVVVGTSGGVDAESGWSWRVGAFTGDAAGGPRAVGPALNYAARPPRRFRLDGADPWSPGLELVAHARWSTLVTSATVAIGFSGAYDVDPVATEDYWLRAAPEVEVVVGRWRGRAVGYFATFLRDVSREPAIAGFGGLIEVSGRLWPWLTVGARFGRVATLEAYRLDALARAAGLAAFGRATDGVPGRLERLDEVAFAFAVPVIGDAVSVRTDATLQWYDRVDGTGRHWQVRLQLEIRP